MMDDQPAKEQDVAREGLCATCRHARAIKSDRGTRFLLCERSKTDARFPRYPALPVIRCVGYETRLTDL